MPRTSIDASDPAVLAALPTRVRHHSRLQGAAAALTALVAAVHVIDQGGIPGDKSPGYVGIGYWVLELAALAAAVILYSRTATRWVWALAAGVAAGPLTGFVLSRGPGLPAYTDDRGNWGEPLGIISLVVEGLLLIAALVGFALARRPQRDA